MNKIEIKNRWTGEVIYSHECEDNTIKRTVEQAVKEGVSLDNASLVGASLVGASLVRASLDGASLDNASLVGASLVRASLDGASLVGASLVRASLDGASLDRASLVGASLVRASLVRASLDGASLDRASLVRASLDGASLDNASLVGASLDGASLDGAKGNFFVPLACPSDGAFIGWKKVKGKLVKLLIPEDAKRSSATTNKCRCDKAQVLAITDTDGNNPIQRITNYEYAPCDYIVGETVTPDSFDDNRWNECSHGIHFFINKQEAINYY